MPLRPTNFRLDSEILDALQTIKERDHISITEQVRLALLAWVESRSVRVRVRDTRDASGVSR